MSQSSSSHPPNLSQTQLPPAPPRPELGAHRFGPPFRTDHQYAERIQANVGVSFIQNKIMACSEFGVPMVLNMEESMYHSGLYGPNKPGIIMLEKSLLDVGSADHVLQGSFYMLPIYFNRSLYIRYFESGVYRGFIDKVTPILQQIYNVPAASILPWKVYTDYDISPYYPEHYKGKTPASKTYDRKVGSDHGKSSNHTSIMAQLDRMKGDLDNFHMVVFTHHARPNPTKHSQHRFLFCSDLWKAEEKMAIDRLLSEHLTTSSPPPQLSTAISHIASMPTSTPKDQFLLLNTISNYHWCTLPYHHDGKIIAQRQKVSYVQHLLFYSEPEEGIRKRKNRNYLPSSPRNRIMYTLDSNDNSPLPSLISHLLTKDGHLQESEDPLNLNQDTQPPPKKRRKHTRRLVHITPESIMEHVGDSLMSKLNCAATNRTIYVDFTEQLLTDGVIRWRNHSTCEDTCIMNDYHSENGVLLPNSFVHVTCITDPNEDEFLLKCTCAIFSLLQRTANQGHKLLPDDIELFPDADSLTCMHCRFYKDYLFNAYASSTSGTDGLSPAVQKVKESLQYMNDPMQLVGNVLPQATTKFSVKDDNGNPSLVHITFPHNKCYARCMNGMCAANLRNKKRIPKSFSFKEPERLCPHFQTMIKQLDLLQSFFPNYFNSADDSPDQPIGLHQANNDDGNLSPEKPATFNKDTGLWEFPALSKHKPLEEDDPKFISGVQRRSNFTTSVNMDYTSGLYSGFTLIPKIHDQSGTRRKCKCGDDYPDWQPVLKLTTTLFSRNGAIQCKCYNVTCSNGMPECELSYKEVAEEQGIFFYSEKTAAGDEIGHDFFSIIDHGRLSMTAYCRELTRRYKTTNLSSRDFMAPTTFISWLFGWMAAMKIDFRKEVDPWCQHNPKVLACDGTHIGISMKHHNVEESITRPDTDDILKPLHKRNNRVLIQDISARKHLRYLCKRMLKREEELEDDEQNRRSLHLLTYVEANCHQHVYNFISTFVHETQGERILKAMARFLFLLSGDAALSTVAPFGSHDVITKVCEDALQHNRNPANMNNLREWSTEIGELLVEAERTGSNALVQIVVDFTIHILSKVVEIHQNDRPAPPPVRQPGTYDPRTGSAYYFTSHGDKVRDMPHYEVSGKNNKNWDDRPEVEEPCRKIYPEVSLGGFGYIFLWFCPIHGHSYGFHIIEGGEGRKDPFSALFKYMPVMPDHIFYDFACQLSEYCLNREPALFKYTRFWHDLFHLVGHLCGYNFKSGRIVGLEDLNTEICEQWNSLLQSVKYTASHFTQDHFVFFLQHSLHRLNKKKTEKFMQQAKIALAGRF